MRVLGFPLHVRPGFLIFMLLIVFLYGDEFGVWLAASIAGFTLLHELGHAVAARRAGAEAEISLDFLAGYASYESPRPLSRGTQAVIALAGPVTHVTAGLIVLALMGVNPLEATSRGSSAASAAVWWAGPVIGAFNLIPVLPLDGGNVVASLLDRVVPGRARPIMIYGSVAVTAVAAVVFALSTQLRGFVVFLGLILLMQLQMVFDERARHAESPFDKALAALAKGDDERARKILVKGLSRPGEVSVAPRRLDDEATRRLLALLPRPLPHGDPWNEYVLTNLLLRVGAYEEAAHYGAASFERAPRSKIAATVARAAGALGDNETAVAWLHAAARQGTFTENVATVIDQAPELAAIRHRPDVVELRGTLHR
jgi:Zn-dependent protease